jgi:DNA-binding transcriptional ArsR family regulator
MAYILPAPAALSALSDGTRRAIFERVARAPAAVGAIAAGLPVSRPAVSQHLKVLKAAGLVSEERLGTQRIYRLDPRGIAEMRNWLDSLWSDALGAFAAYADTNEEEKG